MIGQVFGFEAGQLLSQVADHVVMITNHHVVQRGNPVVIDRQGTKTLGRVLAVDRDNDLAAISVPWTRSGIGSMADSDRLHIGQIAASMGHPLDSPYEGSIGIVSGIDRSSLVRQERRKLLQLDLRLLPGNSGGPIVGEDGRMIGLACMVASPGIGLAIPANTVEEFVRQVKFRRRAA